MSAGEQEAPVLVRMELSRVLIRELSDYQLIELREVVDSGSEDAEPRSFPIVIGLPEAMAIERRLQGLPIARPQTHDLLASVIDELGGRLERIAVTDLSDQTFYASLSIRLPDGSLREIDCRPSDAIALGAATDASIFVDETVLEAASRDEL